MENETGFEPIRLTEDAYFTEEALRTFLSQFHTPREVLEDRVRRLHAFLVRVAATPGIGPEIGSRCSTCGRTAAQQCTDGRANGRGGHIHEPWKVCISMMDIVKHADILSQADGVNRTPIIATDIERIVRHRQ